MLSGTSIHRLQCFVKSLARDYIQVRGIKGKAPWVRPKPVVTGRIKPLEIPVIKAQKRIEYGRHYCRQVRLMDKIPAVIHGRKGEETIKILLDRQKLEDMERRKGDLMLTVDTKDVEGEKILATPVRLICNAYTHNFMNMAWKKVTPSELPRTIGQEYNEYQERKKRDEANARYATRIGLFKLDLERKNNKKLREEGKLPPLVIPPGTTAATPPATSPKDNKAAAK